MLCGVILVAIPVNRLECVRHNMKWFRNYFIGFVWYDLHACSEGELNCNNPNNEVYILFPSISRGEKEKRVNYMLPRVL